jgi:hypothetical protein
MKVYGDMIAIVRFLWYNQKDNSTSNGKLTREPAIVYGNDFDIYTRCLRKVASSSLKEQLVREGRQIKGNEPEWFLVDSPSSYLHIMKVSNEEKWTLVDGWKIIGPCQGKTWLSSAVELIHLLWKHCE